MSCRADKIAKLNKKISDLREYDKICTANGGLPQEDRRKLYYDHIFLVA